MKKIATIFIFLFYGICYADSVFLYNNSFIPEWAFQIIYKEKYFENTTYYVKYNFIDNYIYIDNSYTEISRGFEHNIMLRFGMPKDYMLNVNFDFIFQKAGILDYNNLQAIDFTVEKKIDFINIVAGLKIPILFDMKQSPYLIDKRERLNLLTGLMVYLNPGLIKFYFIFFNEENLNINNYFGTKDIIFTVGFDFISNDIQKVGVYIENDLKINTFDNLQSYIYYFIPQVKIDFYNDFYFIIGAEFYLLTENVFLNKYNNPLYIFKLSYVMNIDKTEKKEEKKEEKVRFEKKKWWQIENVDDEMIPDSWKAMEEPKSR